MHKVNPYKGATNMKSIDENKNRTICLSLLGFLNTIFILWRARSDIRRFSDFLNCLDSHFTLDVQNTMKKC